MGDNIASLYFGLALARITSNTVVHGDYQICYVPDNLEKKRIMAVVRWQHSPKMLNSLGIPPVG